MPAQPARSLPDLHRRRGLSAATLLWCLSLSHSVLSLAGPGFAPPRTWDACETRQRSRPASSCQQMRGPDSVVREIPLPRSLSRILLGLRGVPQQEAEASAGSAAISVRSLSSEELAETGEGSKLDLVAKLCTRGMFGEANAGGSSWVLRNFKAKYGEEAAAGRQSIMLVAETSDGDIVGCVGMELMLLTEDGRAWWANPCAVIKKRPFVSDLVVNATYRQRGLGRSLLLKCHDIVTGQWAEEIRAMTPAERLDLDMDRIFLKVDAENRAAVRLYRRMGYKEVAILPEELMVPKSPTSVQEWPVLNIYMGRDLRPFNPLAHFKGG